MYVDENGYGCTRNLKDQIVEFNIKIGKIIRASSKPFDGGFAYEDKMMFKEKLP